MKKFLAMATAAALAATSANAVELRLSTAAPEASPWGHTYTAFTAKVAELSGGSLTIKHFHASQLGDEQAIASASVITPVFFIQSQILFLSG